jgi:hypothetical protein
VNANADQILNNITPLTTVVAIAIILFAVFKRITKGQEGKDSLLSLLWYAPVAFIGAKPKTLIVLGQFLYTVVTNIVSMLGFGSIGG